jgi:hypothetical protein
VASLFIFVNNSYLITAGVAELATVRSSDVSSESAKKKETGFSELSSSDVSIRKRNPFSNRPEKTSRRNSSGELSRSVTNEVSLMNC